MYVGWMAQVMVTKKPHYKEREIWKKLEDRENIFFLWLSYIDSHLVMRQAFFNSLLGFGLLQK